VYIEKASIYIPYLNLLYLVLLQYIITAHHGDGNEKSLPCDVIVNITVMNIKSHELNLPIDTEAYLGTTR